MIQANELRIGNLVKTYEYPGGNTVTSITEKYIDLKGSNIINIERIEPIPLTPEWLERAGFHTVNEDERIGFYLFVNGCRLLGLKFCNDPINLGLDWNGTTITTDIRYVHTLQNLYHALTGKELEFNLDNLN